MFRPKSLTFLVNHVGKYDYNALAYVFTKLPLNTNKVKHSKLGMIYFFSFFSQITWYLEIEN